MKKLLIFALVLLSVPVLAQGYYTYADTVAVSTVAVGETFTTAYTQAAFMAIDNDIGIKVGSDTSLLGQEWVLIPENSAIEYGPLNRIMRYSAITSSGTATLQIIGIKKTKPY